MYGRRIITRFWSYSNNWFKDILWCFAFPFYSIFLCALENIKSEKSVPPEMQFFHSTLLYLGVLFVYFGNLKAYMVWFVNCKIAIIGKRGISREKSIIQKIFSIYSLTLDIIVLLYYPFFTYIYTLYIYTSDIKWNHTFNTEEFTILHFFKY